MSVILLPSLEIANFRIFEHLRIEQLSQINLIVGKNNVGKTTLLEALWFYARRGVPAVALDQIARREEISSSNYGTITSLRHLFTNRPERLEPGLELHIGSLHTQDIRLSVGIEGKSNGHFSPTSATPRYVIHYDGEICLDVELLASILDIDGLPTLANVRAAILTADGQMNPAYLESLWESITLTDDEERIIEWLRLIEPKVERINFKSDPQTRSQRVPMLRVIGNQEPIALRSYGDGLVRLFAIALAAFNARGGLLLIDEFEIGIHYSVQPQLWRLLFQLATDLNIQVFATTHSWDCIAAFQQVASIYTNIGQVVRLGRKSHEIVASLYNTELLRMAVEQEVEVR